MISKKITLDKLIIRKGKLSFQSRTALIKDVFTNFKNSNNKKDKLKFFKVLKMFRQEYSNAKNKINQIIRLFIKDQPSELYLPTFFEEIEQKFQNIAKNQKLIHRNI